MKQIKELKYYFLIAGIVSILTFASFFTLSSKANSISATPLNVFQTACKAINEKFYFNTSLDFQKLQSEFESKINTLKDAHLYIETLIKKLNDPYTRFLTKEEFKDELDIINSTLIGIGIKLDYKKPVILEVLPDSPAYKNGLKANDYIVAVNNIDTKKLDSTRVSKYLKGPKGTKVKIKVKRGLDTVEKTIVRKELEFKAVSSKMLEDNIALLKISSFIPKDTSKICKDEIQKLMSADGLIIDLRNNSGGLLKNAVEIADMFLSEGKIVSTVQGTKKANEFANSTTVYDGEVVILVNENSASASEILASALKENGRAKIIGKRTFGKGLVQEIVKLPDESAMHITTAAYLTPKGKNINKIGVAPDKIVRNTKAQLDAAKKYLKLIANNKKEQNFLLSSLSH